MIIILKRIPESSRKTDVQDFLKPVLKGKIFQKKGLIQSIKLMSFKDTRTHIVDHHSLVSIDSDVAAERVIKKLNRKVFKGKHIEIKEYYHRSWRNDSRTNLDESDGITNRKKRFDRRKPILKETKRSKISYSSLESFHKKL